MANIAIVNYCNLKCKYCFADDMIQEESSCITIDDYRRILEFLSRTPKNHVGIIGGEPTLHPQFEEILKETNTYCRECNSRATLFTNGINLEKFMPYIGERIGLLINCNAPEWQDGKKFDSLMKTLDHMHELSWFDGKVSIGCNVFPGQKDYSFIWKIVDKYNIGHLRTSVVSPGGCYAAMRSDKEKYYMDMKPIFLEHCKNAIKHKCILNMDCGHIPFCYFTKEEEEIILEACGGHYTNEFCEPVVDITPEFKATACFGAYDPIDIRDFNDLFELERYLLAEKTLPRAKANTSGRCATCRKHKLLQCQGGCLGFAEVE